MTVSSTVRSCSHWDGYSFDPRTHISAANNLRTMEEGRLIADLKDYCREIDPTNLLNEITKLILLLRVLFQPIESDNGWPMPKIGSPVDGPEPSKDRPLYPIDLTEEVPLLVVGGVMLAGLPEDPLTQVLFAQRKCRLRSAPLRPPDNPLTLDNGRAMIRGQLLRLVRDVYSPSDLSDPISVAALEDPATWSAHRQTFERLGAVWSVSSGRYVLKG